MGFAAAPSLTRANALGQYLFVNGRPVRDKLILGAVRAAYSDYLPRDRHPVVALFVTLAPQEVDANVHPAKTEVRFRNAGLVRALIVHALKEGLAREGKRTAANVDGAAISAFRPAFAPRPAGPVNWDWQRSPAFPEESRRLDHGRLSGAAAATAFAEPGQAAFDVGTPTADVRFESAPPIDLLDRPLVRRAPRSTRPTSSRKPATAWSWSTSMPRMSASFMRGSRPRWPRTVCSGKILLIPRSSSWTKHGREARRSRRELASFGLAIDSFGPGAVAVRETPSLLGKADAARCCAISPSTWRNGTKRCRWNAG